MKSKTKITDIIFELKQELEGIEKHIGTFDEGEQEEIREIVEKALSDLQVV